MHDPPFLTRSRMRTRTSRTETLAGTGEVERERRRIGMRRVANNATRTRTESLALQPADSPFALSASCAIVPFLHHGKTSMFRSSYQSSLLSYRGHSGQNT